MIRSARTETAAIAISDIIDADDRQVVVLVTATGKPLRLPRAHVDFMPGMAILPAWLAKRIFGGDK